MTEETCIRVEHAIEKLLHDGRIFLRRTKQSKKSGGGFQVLALEEFRGVVGQNAIGTVEQNPGLALYQQAHLRQFVFENGASHQSMHNSFRFAPDFLSASL